MNGEGDREDQQAQAVSGEIVPGNDPPQGQEGEVQEGGSQDDDPSDGEDALADNGEGEDSQIIVDKKVFKSIQKLAPAPRSRGRVKLPNLPVPTFSAHPKEDVNVFFDQLENIAEIYGWSDRLTLETALASFKANAHAWAMELERDRKKDYQKFKSLAIETFEKSVPSWLRSKMLLTVRQLPGQDSQDFAATLRKIQLTLQGPSDSMLSAYLCGLNERLAQMVAMHEPQSFEEAVRMAKKFEAITTNWTGYGVDRGTKSRTFHD